MRNAIGPDHAGFRCGMAMFESYVRVCAIVEL
jgi:hypothetical protein